ncbi:MAG: DUF1844 domain-containing protein [Planctomycetes bacterium]|nr:DUF1844 domain-containing protein [Planctomycetota bacterium]
MSEDKKIFIDEDWKSQVEAEKSAAEAVRKAGGSQPPAPAAAPKSGSKQAAAENVIPPADLSTLVSLLATQAMVSLGALPNPLSHQVETDPAQARHFIDLLEMLDKKTQGNTTPQEARLLDGILHELRIAWVQTQQASGRQQQQQQ